MCGIIAVLGDVFQSLDKKKLEQLLDLINKRGPDYESPIRNIDTKCGLRITSKASVLHLRGETAKLQPVEDDLGNLFLFNGQVYAFDGLPIDAHLSDTEYLFRLFTQCNSKNDLIKLISLIDGPFAFIFWHNEMNCLFYGRDFFGRKSLCLANNVGNPSSQVILSSVSKNDLCTTDAQRLSWSELDCLGIYCIDFTTFDEPKTYLFAWNIDLVYPKTPKCRHSESSFQCISVPGAISTPLKPLNCSHGQIANKTSEINYVEKLGHLLVDAVDKRVRYNRENCLRCRRQQLESTGKCTHSKVAVAFSGGIDSTLLAFALDKVMNQQETIDLVTVAFRPDSSDRESAGSAFEELTQLCPTRNWRFIACDISVDELQERRKSPIMDLILPCDTVLDDSLGCASWFVGRATGRALNSNKMDITESRQALNSFLTFDPSNKICEPGKLVYNYTSPASMIFVGSSIDEQLGGYSSHRQAWTSSGPAGLAQEISFLMRRLSSRNLGRDDRIYSHHGRDIKLPYLDTELVSYLNELPIQLKMNLDEELGVGTKKILRQLAQSWGFSETSRRVKKAMQFGTRIANLEGPRERGNDICTRLKPDIST